MAKIRDQNVHPRAQFATERVVVPVISAINLAGAVVFSYLPAYKYELVRVRTFCRAKTNALSGNVKVGVRTACPLVFTAATEVAGVLSATAANLKGSASEAITIEITSDGTGALLNGTVVLEIRPRAVRVTER